MKLNLLIFPKLNFNQIYFFLFFIISFIRLIIRKWIDDNNKDISQRLFNIYIYNISDLFCIIPILIDKCFFSKKQKKSITSNTSNHSILLIVRDEQKKRLKSILFRTFIVAISDLIAQLPIFIYYVIKGENERDIEEYNLSSLLIVRICSLYLLSLVILKTHFYRHHYFSFVINIICLIFMSLIDIFNIIKTKNKDNKYIIIYVLVKIFSTIFYQIEDVYGKKSLMKEFLTPYLILMYKGIYEFFFLIILSIPLIFIKTKDATDNYEKSIIFTRFDNFIDKIYIIKNISLMITNFFYNLIMWIIIDKYSPSHLAMANVFESFGASLYLVIFERDKTDIWTIYVTFAIYIFLFFGTFIHNEFIVITVCGLHENTNLFLAYRANLDLIQAEYSISEELSSHENVNDNEQNEQIFEMNEDGN